MQSPTKPPQAPQKGKRKRAEDQKPFHQDDLKQTVRNLFDPKEEPTLEKELGALTISDSQSKQAKRVKHQGGWYAIHTGEKGGRYILVHGQKKYLRKRA